MGPIKKIRYNCRKATYLIEKKQISTITFVERIELVIHLAGCSICRTFEKQSKLINQVVKDLFRSSVTPPTQLDEEYKRNLQTRIDEQLNNNQNH